MHPQAFTLRKQNKMMHLNLLSFPFFRYLVLEDAIQNNWDLQDCFHLHITNMKIPKICLPWSDERSLSNKRVIPTSNSKRSYLGRTRLEISFTSSHTVVFPT